MQKNAALNGKLLHWFRRFIWLPSKWIFTPVALVCIAYIVWLSRFSILALWNASNAALLVVACVFLGLAHVVLPLTSRMILRLFGTTVDYRAVLKIHLRRLPARYLPGGVWHTVGRAVDLHDHGVPKTTIGWMVALEQGLSVGIALVLGGGLLLFFGGQATSYTWMVALTAASALVAIVVLPSFIRRYGSNAASNVRPREWAECYLRFALVWTFQAAAFVAYSAALVGADTVNDMLHAAGVYLFAWAIGYIAFFAPQGIGVFEATASALSGQALLPASIAMLAGFRLCMLLVDLCLGLLGRCIGGHDGQTLKT